MKALTMQPTFRMDVGIPVDEFMPKVRLAIQSPDLREGVASAGHCLDFHIDRAERRFWSPHLNVQIDESETGSELFCRFSPRPEVWTMFMCVYLVAACLIFAAAIYGYVQWFLGHPPWSLVLIPIGLLVIGSLHLASLTGQRMSSDQMQVLRERLERTVERALASD